MKKFIRSSDSTIVMAVCFFLSITGIAFIAGVVILYLKVKYEKDLERSLADLDSLKAKYESEKAKLDLEIDADTKRLQRTKQQISDEINSLQKEVMTAAVNIIASEYNFTDYDGLSSSECKNKLSLLKTKEQEMIKNEKFMILFGTDYFSNKAVKNNIKQLLRCFNSECDNVLLNLSVKTIDTSRNKIQKSYESLNKIFETDGIKLSDSFLENKLEQLNLIYTYECKKEQEREEQKAIREQMVEEEKVRREIEREKAKIEKEEAQFKGEVSKLIQYLNKTSNDAEKALYIDKINELERKLTALEKDKENVLQREQNTRAGFVYVISNIGSFGENVYKIGMTRRLEPMDRVNELSSASVPFSFDVHAMIFSEDAPTLETTLHNHFRDYMVNKVNYRKEFFKIDLSEIEKVVKENHNSTATFTLIADAKEYRDSIKLFA